MSVINDVYNSLSNSADLIASRMAELKKEEQKAASGDYSEAALSTKIKPKIFELKRAVKKDTEDAITAAYGIVSKYRDEVSESLNLDPALLTDDIKLLSGNIPLEARDIQAILKRSEGNKTMTQIALRYARNHKIKVDNMVFNSEEEALARSLEMIIYYYKNWIEKPNANEMLDKFFAKFHE